MSIEQLFTPGKIGSLEIKNRIYMSPMATNFVASDGSVTRELIDYFEERARGGVGFMVTGSTHVERVIVRGSITGSNPRLDDHRYIVGLSELTDSVHQYGARIFSQITLGQGSFSIPKLFPPGCRAVAPSPIKNPVFPDWIPHVLSVDEIEALIEAYGKAALRAKIAGFDGIEIHGHGMYLLAQFMSPYTNKRKDKYGDPLALPLALVKAVKHHAGEDYPITFRFHIDEFLKGGRDLERSKREALILEKAGIHAVNISGGNFWVPGSAANQAPPMSYAQGHLRSLAKAMKDTVRIPVMLSSKIGDSRVASDLIQNGEADFIGLGRGLLADPDWPNKVAERRFDEIRPCIRDMDGCLGRLMFKRITCTVNPRCGKEGKYKIEPTQKPKKVIVAGGGVGGMEAARVAAMRGHRVTLFERSDRLGGQVRWAGMIPHKGDINPLIQYLATQLKRLGVTINFGQEVTPDLVTSLQPEVVIVATGSRPLVLEIPGIDGSNIFFARDVVTERVEVMGEKIVVAGGGFVGCDTALFLAEKKRKKVTIIEQLTFQEVGIEPYNMQYMDLMRLLGENNVKTMTETKIEEITKRGVRATGKDKKNHRIEADSVVLAMGAVAENGLVQRLRGKVSEIHAIGDCNRPGKVIDAIHQGFHVAFGL
jgi:2,4-dienoyl-CoA reductase-like NADH-dependent reductase (Old Yellow Enzyme family)/thioredoxin reductase